MRQIDFGSGCAADGADPAERAHSAPAGGAQRPPSWILGAPVTNERKRWETGMTGQGKEGVRLDWAVFNVFTNTV